MIRVLLISICLISGTLNLVMGQGNSKIPRMWVMFDFHPEFYPQSWYSSPIDFHARGLSMKERIRCRLIFTLFRYKYLPLFVEFHAQHFSFLEYINMYGQNISYLLKEDHVLILNIGAELGTTDEWIEFALHRCFAEILWNKYGSLELERQFASMNPRGFKYSSKIPESQADGSSDFTLESSLFPFGFHTKMSTVSFEHDFFGLSAQLFMARQDFALAVFRSKALQRKARFVLNYYTNLVPEMDLKWFTERLPGIKLPPDLIECAKEGER